MSSEPLPIRMPSGSTPRTLAGGLAEGVAERVGILAEPVAGQRGADRLEDARGGRVGVLVGVELDDVRVVELLAGRVARPCATDSRMPATLNPSTKYEPRKPKVDTPERRWFAFRISCIGFRPTSSPPMTGTLSAFGCGRAVRSVVVGADLDAAGVAGQAFLLGQEDDVRGDLAAGHCG